MAKVKETGQDEPRPKDKGKEIKSLLEAKGTEVALMTKEVVSKAKDVEPKSKVAGPKDDPSRAKA